MIKFCIDVETIPIYGSDNIRYLVKLFHLKFKRILAGFHFKLSIPGLSRYLRPLLWHVQIQNLLQLNWDDYKN